MVFKFISNNFKKFKIQYIMIFFCEIILLGVSLFASCTVMNYVIEKNYAVENAKGFTFSFPDAEGLSPNDPKYAEKIDKCPDAESLRERIYEFCRRSPVELSYVSIRLADNKYNYTVTDYYFVTYDDLVDFYEKSMSMSAGTYPTEEQYLNHEKVVVLGMLPTWLGRDPFAYSDESHVLFGKNDDEYLVVGNNPINDCFSILWGSEPDNSKVCSVALISKDLVTDEQKKETEALFKEIVAPDINIANTWLPSNDGLLEIRKSVSIIIMTLALLVISAFIILAIFKYMTDEHRNEYAVLRLCGYGKFKALAFPFVEIISISAVCSVLSCVIFSLFIPLLKKNFPAVAVLFDFGFFAIFTVGFIAITAIMFAVYIAPSLNKSVSDELREM